MKEKARKQNSKKGKLGENRACSYLFWRGYKIVYRNYVCPLGEIDIIAKKGDLLVVIEVKSRASLKFGTPAQAVTPYKVSRIVQATRYYLAENSIVNTQIRFDCMEILNGKVNHIIDAFDAF